VCTELASHAIISRRMTAAVTELESLDAAWATLRRPR
jgi:hypothetical protein